MGYLTTLQLFQMNHHQQAQQHPPQDQRGLGHHHQQQPLGSQPHFQPMHRGPVIRPSPIPANAPTGQLISKCLFGVLVSIKIATSIL